MKKIIIITLMCLAVFACQITNKPIGGDRDKMGCLTGAGYSWDEHVGACIRPWELDDSQKEAAKVVVMPMSYRPVTITKVLTLRCPGCFEVFIQSGDSEPRLVRLVDWKIAGEITSYEECVAAGNPILKSNPPQCMANGQTFTQGLPGKQSLCEDAGGEFNEYEECLGISKEACVTLGGDFKECESACRHDPDAEVCTMQCVIVCDMSGRQIVGDDRDPYGCIPSAGYVWCEAKKKCLREWEENCPQETKPYGFEDCVREGNPVMESYPRKCMAKGITFVEDVGFEEGELIGWEETHKRHVCTPEESAATACTLEYAPVCGEIVLNMGATVYQTFGNACSACAAMKTVAYTPGECQDEPADICYDGEGYYIKLEDAIISARKGCGDSLKLECICPEGYIKEGDACTPTCAYSEPPCMAPSFECPSPVVCNSYTGTYWIDMTTEKEGCSPACVVDVKSGEAEINWRCTGAEPGSAG